MAVLLLNLQNPTCMVIIFLDSTIDLFGTKLSCCSLIVMKGDLSDTLSVDWVTAKTPLFKWVYLNCKRLSLEVEMCCSW